MFACICHAVSVSDVSAAVAAGARDVDDVAERTRATTGCGTCRDTVCDLVARLRPAPASA